jgi:CheY-like chemotaxis protein
VEDNVVNQEIISQMLRQHQLEVFVAASALEGLRALCKTQFDLILMDIMMPIMDGIEALRRFRNRSDPKFDFITPQNVPVVAVTANALVGDEERFLSIGFNGYLSKPFRQSQLVHMLSKHLPPNHDSSAFPNQTIDANPTPASDASKDSLLDLHAMDRLRELDPRGENRLIERVIAAFLQSVDRLVPQLDQARQNRDLAGVRHVAHTFKSSSASIGATKLSKDCADLEAWTRLEAPDHLDQRVFDLCHEISLVSQALKNLLDSGT